MQTTTAAPTVPATEPATTTPATIARSNEQATAMRRGPADARRILSAWWRRVPGDQRFLYLAAGLMMASGVFHAGVWLWDGGAWAGPLSWRKPIVFGLSLGMLAATSAVVLAMIPWGRRARWAFASVLGVGCVTELALITMQTWRGVASHFNEATTFDGIVFIAMGVAIAIVSLCCVILFARSLGRLRATPSMTWAFRAGLVLMLLGQGVGGPMMADAGAALTAALKWPHAAALHAFQVLPLLAWLLERSALPERRRTRVVLGTAAVYLVGLVVALGVILR